MKIKGLDDLLKLIKAFEDATNYVESVDGKKTRGEEFVPDGVVYSNEKQARFAQEHSDIERAFQHEIYEFDRRLKNA